MEKLITYTIESLAFPPGIFILMFAVALMTMGRMPRTGRTIGWTGVILLYLASTPLVARLLIAPLESVSPVTTDELAKAQAIVVLAGGRYDKSPEYDGLDQPGPSTLRRLRYGAHLHRQTGLPILVSGGFATVDQPSLAAIMADGLRTDYGIHKVWLEEQSTTTGENAIFAQEVLCQKGIDAVALVTDAWHMPRSRQAFEKTGLQVVSAPTAYLQDTLPGGGLTAWLPTSEGLEATRTALHEWVGRVWYRIRY